MWCNPLSSMKYVGLTEDSMSFQNINLINEFEVPVGIHVGAFGAVRKFAVHGGVDMYAPVGTVVNAVETGKVVDIRQFTGEALGFPWWKDTWAISVEGKTGVVVYGEIAVDPIWKLGDFVFVGDTLGSILQVLTKDKGRPMSMLHLQLHNHGVLRNGGWKLDQAQPKGLKDPTHHLLKMDGYNGL